MCVLILEKIRHCQNEIFCYSRTSAEQSRTSPEQSRAPPEPSRVWHVVSTSQALPINAQTLPTNAPTLPINARTLLINSRTLLINFQSTPDIAKIAKIAKLRVLLLWRCMLARKESRINIFPKNFTQNVEFQENAKCPCDMAVLFPLFTKYVH